jgi:hypothetical protein
MGLKPGPSTAVIAGGVAAPVVLLSPVVLVSALGRKLRCLIGWRIKIPIPINL